MKNCKKTLKIILNVFIWVFVAFSVLMTVLAIAAQSNADGVPAIGGKCFLTVASNSMEDTFCEGDLIVSEMLTDEQKAHLNVNDVVTFYADLDGNGTTELNSHRIVRVIEDGNGGVQSYVTKGDNPVTNPVEDEPVLWSRIICRWTGKSYAGIGSALTFLQSPKGFLIAIVLPLILFFLYELYVFIKTLLAVKAQPAAAGAAPTITAEQEEAIKQKAIEEFLRQQQQAAGTAPVPEEPVAPPTETAPAETDSTETAPAEDADGEETK